MAKRNTKVARVLKEFDDWCYHNAAKATMETGKRHSKYDIQRMVTRSPITTKKGKIDWRLL